MFYKINTNMNNLSLEIQPNKAIEGYSIYNNELIEQINKREYGVKGRYIVEDLSTEGDIQPFFKCSCPDHVYRGSRCKHIIAVEFYLLDKVNNGA